MQHDGKIRLDRADGFDQVILTARQGHPRPVVPFGFKIVRKPDEENGDVGFLRRRDGLRAQRRVDFVRVVVKAFGEADVRGERFRGFDGGVDPPGVDMR